ncbi:hypothetical protein CDAR_544131 [Caerostris darwini]|uniref:Uncharacterized protein n=1 Tax=Caerostris darwini TaxID=1538125 RepID=A0AAV4TL36_9ARAC|nr:hypothetical protein CDAR_544131 [Caerostris darwini]
MGHDRFSNPQKEIEGYLTLGRKRKTLLSIVLNMHPLGRIKSIKLLEDTECVRPAASTQTGWSPGRSTIRLLPGVRERGGWKGVCRRFSESACRVH